jgi:hypothetical protein
MTSYSLFKIFDETFQESKECLQAADKINLLKSYGCEHEQSQLRTLEDKYQVQKLPTLVRVKGCFISWTFW